MGDTLPYRAGCLLRDKAAPFLLNLGADLAFRCDGLGRRLQFFVGAESEATSKERA